MQCFMQSTFYKSNSIIPIYVEPYAHSPQPPEIAMKTKKPRTCSWKLIKATSKYLWGNIRSARVAFSGELSISYYVQNKTYNIIKSLTASSFSLIWTSPCVYYRHHTFVRIVGLLSNLGQKYAMQPQTLRLNYFFL